MLDDFKDKTHFKVIVKTNAYSTEILGYDDNYEAYRMNVKAEPIEGKANIEIVKFFKKKYKLKVEIISGKTSKEKLIKII
ncbi:YggU family protein [archaeon D22]|nr:YggU family protein [archaeon D22]